MHITPLLTYSASVKSLKVKKKYYWQSVDKDFHATPNFTVYVYTVLSAYSFTVVSPTHAWLGDSIQYVRYQLSQMFI